MVACEVAWAVSWHYKNDQQLNVAHDVYSIFFLCNHEVNPAEGPTRSTLVESKKGVYQMSTIIIVLVVVLATAWALWNVVSWIYDKICSQ